MVNFMSCSDTELRPGPGFNVVVGPNGTGKLVALNIVGGGVDIDYLFIIISRQIDHCMRHHIGARGPGQVPRKAEAPFGFCEQYESRHRRLDRD